MSLHNLQSFSPFLRSYWHHLPVTCLASDVLEYIVLPRTGVDTVGDVRLPAACCGVLGFRSSHGVVSIVGNIPTSPSLDAVGMVPTSHKKLTSCMAHSLTQIPRSKLFWPLTSHMRQNLFSSNLAERFHLILMNQFKTEVCPLSQIQFAIFTCNKMFMEEEF